MAVITVSSTYGSGGSVVASLVADRLGWDMHNRAIPAEVASRLSIPLETALANDEASETRIGRVQAKFSVHLASESAGSVPPRSSFGKMRLGSTASRSFAVWRRILTV
jgi:hypothetical protein